jgi:DNA-binding NarL/FixJ family response regulator
VRQILPRDCPPGDLVAAVIVARGERPVADRGVGSGTPGVPTRRELEVMTLLAKGLSNREIAEHLMISEHTVRNHLGHVFGKLAVSSRTQAVVRASEIGWLRLPG